MVSPYTAEPVGTVTPTPTESSDLESRNGPLDWYGAPTSPDRISELDLRWTLLVAKTTQLLLGIVTVTMSLCVAPSLSVTVNVNEYVAGTLTAVVNGMGVP